MNPQETRSILTLCLLAAYADGEKHDREREAIRRVAEALAQDDSLNMPSLYQDVLLQRATLQTATAGLQTPQARQLAYEMAVCVCDADGAVSPNEAAFLSQLRSALGLADSQAQAIDSTAQSLAQAPLPTAADPQAPTAPTATASPATAQDGTPRNVSTLSQADMDKRILNAAILNGAIELLPESLSTMAIIPLQMRLVYQIGKSYGYELDRGHIKDFLATAGVGMTSQYLEQAGRKLLGGLLGKAGKGLLGGLGKQAISTGMSFAATYALGHVANQYYATGRTLSTQMLKDAYSHTMQKGKNLHASYLPQIQERARTLDTAQILAMVRGGNPTSGQNPF